ncbi:hypothetical protein BLGI_4176 [Brevibacillus laterosporus GI-9]|nr:hypothetical protein BLGI_4176 [Brevibacillus laterosporus GI-9]
MEDSWGSNGSTCSKLIPGLGFGGSCTMTGSGGFPLLGKRLKLSRLRSGSTGRSLPNIIFIS